MTPHREIGPALDASLVICTHNRSRALADTLRSYSELDFDDDVRAELIVVDNDSTDDTRNVVDAFREHHPGTRYVFEPQPGLSHARNTGIRESRGAVVAFADDDVFFEPRWLSALMALFRDYPEAACAGGRSVPRFEGDRPPWLADALMPMYACRDFGNAVRRLVFPEYPYGVNMAFRRGVFDIVGLFDPNLGRRRSSLLSCEESEMFRRVDRAGLTVMYTPEAVLHHRIPPARMRKGWAMKRVYWQGASEVAMKEALTPSSRRALLLAAARAGRRLVRDCTGGHLSPGGVYRHLKSRTFHEQLRWIVELARIQWSVREASRLGSIARQGATPPVATVLRRGE